MKRVIVSLNAKFIHSSLASRCIAAYCNSRGMEVCFKEFNINQHKSFVLDELIKLRAHVLGFSCYIWNIEMILALASDIKKISPDTTIVLGGPEVSFDSDKFVKCEGVDYVVSGNGEESFYQLCLSIEKGLIPGEVSNLTYCKGAEVFVNTQKSLDINSLPFPYENLSGLENKLVYYETSRGCPYNCQYCLSSGHVLSSRSLDRVFDELKFFIDKRVRQVKLVDRTFNYNKARAMDIWHFLMENDMGVTNFHFEIMAELLDEDSISLLSAARKGLFQFEIGIQSTNPKTRNEIERHGSLESAFENIRRVTSFGNIHIHLDLIAGLPYESYLCFKKSFNDVISLKPHQLQLGFLKLLRGSGLRSRAEDYGIAFSSRAPYEVLYTKDISFGQLAMLRRIEEAVEILYNSGRFQNSLRFVEQFFPSSFDFYEAFAKLWEEGGCHTVSHSRLGLIKTTKDLLALLLPDKAEEITELLRFDLLLSERISPPDFLKPMDITKRQLSEELSQGNFGTLLQTNETLVKSNCYAQEFRVDVLGFAQGKELTTKQTRVLFVYGSEVKSFSLN